MMRAQFPWFGGKRRVAPEVWARFGDVPNYVEPFAGSLAVLLARPSAPRVETVNDLDAYLANFWRALRADPEAVARHAGDPVNEADLHARHRWLVAQGPFRERMLADPDHYDATVAGWWVWGLSLWIGSGWCAMPQWTGRANAGRRSRGVHADASRSAQVPHLITAGRDTTARGLDEPMAARQVRDLTSGGRGVHGAGIAQQLPALSDRAACGEHAARGQQDGRLPPHKVGTLCGERAMFRTTEQLPEVHPKGAGRGVSASCGYPDRLIGYFTALAERLARVRVCCGSWTRVLTPSVTTAHGVTGVLLDPPYAQAERDKVYRVETDVSAEVRAWAIAHGENPLLRIALCGYEGEHEMPASWSVHAWTAHGGYGNQGAASTRGSANRRRERIWFSPHCLPASGPLDLFGGAA